MRVELSQSELNELIYALGFTQMYGKLRNEKVANQLDTKLYRALAIENARLESEEDLGPEYDSAGFTEDDRIVNGQYRNIEK
jgi:hypothetical protein